MKQHVTLLAIFLLPFLAYPSCAQTPEFIVKGICKYRNPDEPLVAENIVSLDYRNLSHHAFMSKDFDRFPNLQAIVLSQHEDEPTELLLERISFGAEARPRDRPSSIGLALHPYLLNTKDSGVFLVGCCT